MEKRWNQLEVEAGLVALAGLAWIPGKRGDGAVRALDALQRFFGTRLDLVHVSAFEMEGVPAIAEAVRDPWLRLQLVRAAIVLVMLDAAPTRAQLDAIRALASALAVDEPGIVDLELYMKGSKLRLRRHLLPRFWAFDRLRARIVERGFFRAVYPAVSATLFRRYENAELAARFAALRTLPEGSLGRGFLAYLDANHFPLPGELGSVSDIIVAHDLGHVLGGYGTTPGEEVLIASFSAGHRSKDPFAFILFVLFQFHLGIQVTPGAAPEVGYFDPARVLSAIERGAAMNVDLSADWNYFDVMDQPIASLRKRYALPPRRDAASVEYGRVAPDSVVSHVS